jgi:hypothetical protein
MVRRSRHPHGDFAGLDRGLFSGPRKLLVNTRARHSAGVRRSKDFFQFFIWQSVARTFGWRCRVSNVIVRTLVLA